MAKGQFNNFLTQTLHVTQVVFHEYFLVTSHSQRHYLDNLPAMTNVVLIWQNIFNRKSIVTMFISIFFKFTQLHSLTVKLVSHSVKNSIRETIFIVSQFDRETARCWFHSSFAEQFIIVASRYGLSNGLCTCISVIEIFKSLLSLNILKCLSCTWLFIPMLNISWYLLRFFDLCL